MGAIYTKVDDLTKIDNLLTPDQSTALKSAVKKDRASLEKTQEKVDNTNEELGKMNVYIQGLADHMRGRLEKNTARNHRMVMFHRNQAFRMRVYTRLLTIAIAVLLGVGGLFYLRRLDIISDTIASVVVAVVLFAVGIYTYMLLTDLRQRYNMDHDKIDFAIPAHMRPGAKENAVEEFASRPVAAAPPAGWVASCAARK